jgi:hypothetical protein
MRELTTVGLKLFRDDDGHHYLDFNDESLVLSQDFINNKVGPIGSVAFNKWCNMQQEKYLALSAWPKPK